MGGGGAGFLRAGTTRNPWFPQLCGLLRGADVLFPQMLLFPALQRSGL